MDENLCCKTDNLQCINAAIILIERLCSENLSGVLSDERIIQNCKDVEILAKLIRRFNDYEED